jgi:PAS domain S-box-containing protein
MLGSPLMSFSESPVASPRDGERVVRLATAEESFQQRELLYRDLLNALPAAIYMTDARGRITFYNEAAVALSGRRPVLGVDEWCVTWKLYWPDGTPLPHDQCPMALALKEGQELRGVEAVAERPDGSRIAFTPYPTLLRDAGGGVVGAVNMLVDITERKSSEERQRLLANEVNHRANNLLTVVQGMVRLTKAHDVEEFREALNGRVAALARAHSLLAKSRWIGADLQHLVTEELSPYLGIEDARVWVSGTILPMEPQAAQSMALIVHELATNAAKHGALSTARGRVMVEWRHVRGEQVVLRWREEGGPSAATPGREGVGSTVIRRAAAHLGAQTSFAWAEDGLVFELTVPKRNITAATTD